MSTNERLDREYPASCAACDTPFRRVDGYTCKACGLNNQSAEAMTIAWRRARGHKITC